MLYDMLAHLAPSPITRLHRAIALRQVHGAAAALAKVDDLEHDLACYALWHATRAELLRELGEAERARACDERARACDERALALTTNPAQQALLAERLTWS